MQKAKELFRAYDGSPESKNYQSNRDKDDEKIQESSKRVTVANDWQRETKALQHKIEQSDRDDNESPEGKEVSYSGDGIAKHSTLPEHNQEKLTDAVLDVGRARQRAKSHPQARHQPNDGR